MTRRNVDTFYAMLQKKLYSVHALPVTFTQKYTHALLLAQNDRELTDPLEISTK